MRSRVEPQNECGTCGGNNVVCMDCKTMRFAKTHRQLCEEYIVFIVGKMCLVDDAECVYAKVKGVRRSDPAHVETVGAMGSDFLALPLCRFHHTMQGTMPVTEFYKAFGIDVYRTTTSHVVEYFTGRQVA